MKRIIPCALIATSLFCLTGTGCDDRINVKERAYTEESKTMIEAMYGFPQISNYFEYGQLKEIYELRDNPNLICYWYTKSELSGKWIYQGKCIGYGIPYSASITSPEQVYYYGNSTTIPLAEPNGIYTNGLSTSATWILSTNSKGDITPIYVESEITVSQEKISANLCEDWSIPSDY